MISTHPSRTRIRVLALLVFLAPMVETHGQEEGRDTTSVSILHFNPDIYHIQNAILNRQVILDPALRRNDFIMSWSPFDSVRISDRSIESDRLLSEDISNWFNRPNTLRLHYSDKSASITAEPILGYTRTLIDARQPSSHFTNGFLIYGNIGPSLTFYARAVDNAMRGDSLRPVRYAPGPGHVPSSDLTASGYDFDEADAQIGFKIGSIQVFLEKMRNRWGYEQSGNVILSDRPPSYPQLRVSVALFDVVRFTWLHAFPYSDILDSTMLYSGNLYRKDYRKKFYAAHLLEYSPTPSVNIALGESIVYSDRIEAAYLNPIVFLRSADHQNNSRDNAQVFGGLRVTPVRGHQVYFTMFIDDIMVSEIFSEKNTNIFSYSVGWHGTNLAVNNLDAAFEYTRCNPWVYTHSDAVADYTSNLLSMGHWLGENADLLSASLMYRWSSGLSTRVYYMRMRKGESGPQSLHYSTPWEQKFLAGKLLQRTEAGVDARFQAWQALLITAVIAVQTQTNDLFPDLGQYSGRMYLEAGFHYNIFN